jgi:hypothetical protein
MKWHRKLLRRYLSPRLLNRINHLSHIEERLYHLEARHAQLAAVVLRERYGNLFACEAGVERQIFSQNGEDGIVLWLLDQVGAPDKTFVEIGIENGRECNSALLGFVLGWDGLMVDGDHLNAAAARTLVREMLAGKLNRVEVKCEFVTAETVDGLVGAGALGVLSIDVDGVDYWLWKAVCRARPRVVVIEYNASLGAESITVPYEPGFSAAEKHPSRYYHGASLAALEKLGAQKGYALVAVDAAGVNAFFVDEAVRPPGLRARPAAELWQPHRERTRLHSPAQQWELIRHLPYEPV